MPKLKIQNIILVSCFKSFCIVLVLFQILHFPNDPVDLYYQYIDTLCIHSYQFIMTNHRLLLLIPIAVFLSGFRVFAPTKAFTTTTTTTRTVVATRSSSRRQTTTTIGTTTSGRIEQPPVVVMMERGRRSRSSTALNMLRFSRMKRDDMVAGGIANNNNNNYLSDDYNNEDTTTLHLDRNALNLHGMGSNAVSVLASDGVGVGGRTGIVVVRGFCDTARRDAKEQHEELMIEHSALMCKATAVFIAVCQLSSMATHGVGGGGIDSHVNGVKLFTILVFMTMGGMPHGAMDVAIMSMTAASDEPGMMVTNAGETRVRRIVPYIVGYVGTVLVMLKLCASYATLMWTCFLLVTSFHFGLGDVLQVPNQRTGLAEKAMYWCEVFARGGIIAYGTVLFHPEMARWVFMTITDDDAAGIQVVMDIASLCGWAALAATGVAVTHHLCRWCFADPNNNPVDPVHPLSVAELSLVSLMCYVLDPLTSLAWYYVMYHSMRHSLVVATGQGMADIERGHDHTSVLQRLHRISVLSIAPTVTVVVFSLVAFNLSSGQLFDGAGISFDKTWLKIVFIGLNALTVPHMLVVELSGLRERVSGALS